MPLNPDLHKVMIIGSGPIVIGQAAEFDYAGSQACRALKDAGLEVVLVNPNPATIMTDHSSADHIYIEPLTLETLRRIDVSEQDAARQASRNTTLSLALLDQSSRTLQALTKQAMPPKAETYGRRGGMRTQHPQAALISGRL